jgi:hypothetical protein
MRKLLTFLIALAAIAVVSPVSAQLSGGLMFPGPGPGRGGGGVGGLRAAMALMASSSSVAR